MSQYDNITDYKHGTHSRLGVLLVNLGTPDAPTALALRHYLAEFLWDPRVVEIPRLIWWLILHGIILRTRPRKSAEAYAKIWMDEGSPLLVYSQRIADELQKSLSKQLDNDVVVRLAMRYGKPDLRSGLLELRQMNVQRLIILPLYPQYSSTTTASTFDAIAAIFKRWRWLPEIRMINHYHDDPGYIDALAGSIREAREQHQGDKLLFSFHGLPKRNLMLGDPYFCECQKTARLAADELGLQKDDYEVCFQSRFGKAEWLKPYTDKTLESWAKAGISSVDVVCPGFPADCLETLEEIAMQNKELYLMAGGKQYHYIPALNDRREHIQMLSDLVQSHAQGWPESEGLSVSEAELNASLQRAVDMGAEH